MAVPSSTVDQNILPVQAYFNLDGSFNTFIGQGQPFVVSATESIGIINTSVSGTFYPTFTAVNTGQVTTLSVTSSVYKFNPGTGELSAPFFDGFLNGTASEANNIAGGASSQLLYQTSANTTGFVPNGISGQFLVSNGTSAPSWSSVATSVTIVDQTSSSSTFYPLFYSATSGSTNTVETSSTKLQYVPSTGTFTSTVFSGSGAGLTNIPNSALTNSSFTLGSTSISLGSTTTTIAGLTSVTSTTFVGALSGNASTATTATTATNATNIGITDNTSSIATWYPTIVSNTTGNLPATTSSTKLSFVPSTGTLAVANLNLTNALGIAYGGTNSTATPTAGGIGYGTGTAHAYSAVGTSGQVLTSAGAGVPIWTTPTTGTVTAVTGTAPIVSSGGNTPVISMAAATTSVNGYLTSTDWTTFNGKQATLVSGTNIKTVGGVSLLGSGDVGTIGVAYGGTGLTTLTANYIPYGNGTSAFQSSSNLQFTGTNLLLNQSYDQGTGVLQVTGQSTFNGVVTDKSLNLQGGNNLLTYSQDFTNGAWTKSNVTATGTYLAPDGTTTANLITTSGTGNCVIYKAISQSSGSTETIYIKPGTNNYAYLNVYCTAGNWYCIVFDLSTTGVVSQIGTNGSAITSVTPLITLTSNGFFRISAAFVSTATVTAYSFGFAPTATGNTFSGDGDANGNASGKTIYAWGAQLELGTVASAYTPTTTTSVTTTNNISVPSGQIITKASTSATDLILTSNTATTGLYLQTTQAGFTLNGTSILDFTATGTYIRMGNTQNLGWGSTTGANASNPDTILTRDAANTLAQKNSTNAQTFRLYNTYTSTSLGEWLSVDWSTTANTATIATKANGAGVVRTLATGNPLVISTGYTVATLPTGVVGMRAYVTDALAPSYSATAVGGGAVKIPVFYNGTNWICA